MRAELDGLVEVVGDAGTVDEAVRAIADAEPDVVLLDVQMPDGGGAEVIRRVAPQRPRCASSRCRSPTRRRTSSRSSAPARAATSPRRSRAPSWPTPCAGSPTATRCSRRGWPASCSTRSRARRRPSRESVDPELDSLTAREQEVLRHIARGYLYKEIALRLDISTKTVEAHVSAVLRKLQLSNRHELSRWAAERRLVD